MTSTQTARDADTAARTYRNLHIGELEVALAASDMPTTGSRVSEEQAWVFVAQGVQRLGLATIRERDTAARQLTARLLDTKDRTTCRALERAYNALFGGARREVQARNTAGLTLHGPHAQLIHRYPRTGSRPTSPARRAA
ncbi:hypothetical protein [Parafrankia sp. FMc2]|uniref:hypothetical protein n=1 Tax=Parafrankia sp. FMc2 TaxID=3233196 RepID=UPI0034D65708